MARIATTAMLASKVTAESQKESSSLSTTERGMVPTVETVDPGWEVILLPPREAVPEVGPCPIGTALEGAGAPGLLPGGREAGSEVGAGAFGAAGA